MKTLILGLLVFIGGCVQATVEESRACDSKTVSFPGAPLNPGLQLPPVTQSFTFDSGVGKDIITKVLLVDGQLSRDDGSSLAFLDEIMVSIAAPNGSSDDLVIWDSQGAANDATSLAVKASDKNLLDYIDSNNNFTVNVTISTQQPPSSDWVLKVDLCVSAEADKMYSF